MSALPALFLVMDGVMKLMKPEIVVKTTVQLGYSEGVILPLGIVLLAGTLFYLIPRTAVLGAILLTGIWAEPLPLMCALEPVCLRFFSRLFSRQ